jgi:hypothetical protein
VCWSPDHEEDAVSDHDARQPAARDRDEATRHHPDGTAHGPHDVPHDDRVPSGAPGAGRRPGVHPEAARAGRTKPAIAGAVALGVVALLVYLAVAAGIIGG